MQSCVAVLQPVFSFGKALRLATGLERSLPHQDDLLPNRECSATVTLLHACPNSGGEGVTPDGGPGFSERGSRGDRNGRRWPHWRTRESSSCAFIICCRQRRWGTHACGGLSCGKGASASGSAKSTERCCIRRTQVVDSAAFLTNHQEVHTCLKHPPTFCCSPPTG